MTDAITPTVTQQPRPRTGVPAMDHVLKARAIQNDRAARAAENARDTAQLFLSGLDAETLQDLLDLQRAAWRRFSALQRSWITDWVGWFDYADKIKGANTMSKLVEMESNILAQAAQLMGSQITGLVALQENIEVDYAYLIKQALAAKRAPAA
jgi:hypothetical protein